MSEQFLIRTVGGPAPGDRFVSSDYIDWPLPDVLTVSTGKYVKLSESQLPVLEGEAAEHLIRGAQYYWTPNDPEDEEDL
jgi:hypothetical protein